MGIHNKSGAKFTVNSFAKIIRNSKYMGVVISNGQTYNNIVPALVDELTFKACNDIMDNQCRVCTENRSYRQTCKGGYGKV